MATIQAETAKEIRKELKVNFPNVKFTVRSEGFSMGDAVNIRYEDGPTTDKVEEIVNKFQYGHFDGMTDMYEFSNSRDDIPQVKYVMVNRDMSDQAEATAIEVLKDNGVIDDETSFQTFNCQYRVAIRRLFNQSL